MIRTTLLLDDALYAELKRRAASEGRTLTEIVEQLLRLGLRAASHTRRGRVELPSYDLGPFLRSPSDRSAYPWPGGARPPERGAADVGEEEP